MSRDVPDRKRRTLAKGLLAGSAFALGACSRKKTGGGDWPELDLAQAEKLFGKAPERGGPIQFQSAVKIVGDGAKSIRTFAPNGLDWVLDAGARGLDRVRVGDLLLVTGKCAGRVHRIAREGDVFKVTLGPAEFTEMIRECRIETSEEVDFSQITPVSAPDMTGSGLILKPSGPLPDTSPEDALIRVEDLAALHGIPERNLLARRALFAPADAAGWKFGMRRISDGPSNARKIVWPKFDAEGIGMIVDVRNDFMHMHFLATLRVGAPRIEARIVADPKRGLEEVSLTLHGSTGLRIGFIAATSAQGDSTMNINEPGDFVPTENSIPLSGLNIFGASLQQRFLVKSAFSARQSYVKALGDYGVSGRLSFGWRNGAPGVWGPKITSTNYSMLDHLDGASIGANGMVLTHQVRVLVGLGLLWFRVGPYVALNNSIGVTRGSDATRIGTNEVCRAVTLDTQVRTGIGWHLPKLFADFVNLILGAGTIKAVGGEDLGVIPVFSETAYAPRTEGCRIDHQGPTVAPNSGGGIADPPQWRAPPSSSPDEAGSPNDGGLPAPDAAPGDSGGGQPGSTPGGLDPKIVCPDQDLRRKLREAGLDVEALCKDSGGQT